MHSPDVLRNPCPVCLGPRHHSTVRRPWAALTTQPQESFGCPQAAAIHSQSSSDCSFARGLGGSRDILMVISTRIETEGNSATQGWMLTSESYSRFISGFFLPVPTSIQLTWNTFIPSRYPALANQEGEGNRLTLDSEVLERKQVWQQSDWTYNLLPTPFYSNQGSR